jgi:hypothetical protein
MFNTALSERAIGKYPLSIATSLAMEALTGINDEINDARIRQPQLQNIPNLWVNVMTLIRNLLGSINRDAAQMVAPEEMAPVIIQEMAIIKDIAEQHTNFRSSVSFYASAYQNMEKQYPHALLRGANTEIQKTTFGIMDETMRIIIEQVGLSATPVTVYKLKLDPPMQPKSFILTHFPYDLLSARNFSELLLIESHTGRVKAKPLWYTKYSSGKELVRIPFREDLLQIFGDNEHFRPLPISIRREIMKLAEQDNWSYMTTKDKIVYSLEKIKDKHALEVIKQIV